MLDNKELEKDTSADPRKKGKSNFGWAMGKKWTHSFDLGINMKLTNKLKSAGF